MSVVRLVPTSGTPAEPPLDDLQAAVMSQVLNGGHHVVLGSVGSGKTTLVVQLAQTAINSALGPDAVVVLAPTRQSAANLRDRVSAGVHAASGAPVARTPASLAFGVLAAQAAALGESRPTLISGAEQDVILKELLKGHLDGTVPALPWPGGIPPEATSLPGFREELRNLLMRAAEAGLGPEQLADLGSSAGQPQWRVAAQLYAEYEDVMALRSTPGDQGARFDPATVISRAAHALKSWESVAAGPVPQWSLIIVDDAQDLTLAAYAFLNACVERGARIVLCGNADQSVQGYRGAVPGMISDAATHLGATVHELTAQHRQGKALAALSANIAMRIGVKAQSSARQGLRPALEAVHAADPDWQHKHANTGAHVPVVTLTAQHHAGQSRAIAAQLRSAHHGLEGPPIAWSRMVVIARSTSQLRQLRSELMAADIPCESLGEACALHQEGAVAALLTLVKAASGEQLTPQAVIAVLTSRLIGFDAVSLRRLRAALVRHDKAQGGNLDSDSLIVKAVMDAAWCQTVQGPEALLASRASRAVAAAAQRIDSGSPGPAQALWAAWSTLGVAQSFRAAAIAGSSRDDADLDAVIALMKAAQTFTERLPRAGVAAFVDYLESQEFSADSLGARAVAQDVVSFSTAAAAAGRQWDLVVIASLQDGVWPNLALRDTLLGAQRLADALSAGLPGAAERASAAADIHAARAAVLDDETRALLVAVSRARVKLIATAVDDGETRPSRYLTLIEQAAGVTRLTGGRTRAVADLREAVAQLRREGERQPDPTAHAVVLAKLAKHDVAGAHPISWHGALRQSTDEPIWAEGEMLKVSPSKVESAQTCALRWALESVGGTRPASQAQELGTLLHELAQRHPGGGESLLSDFELRWSQLRNDDTWKRRVDHANARAKAELLAEYLESRRGVSVELEKGFTLDLGDAVLVGQIDRLEHADGTGYVVDLKTGNSVPSLSEAQSNAQLAMYQLAVASGAVEGIGAVAGAELVYLAGGKKATRRTQSPIDVVGTRAQLDAVIETMRGRSFAATPNAKCGTCPLRHACPARVEGRQVSDS